MIDWNHFSLADATTMIDELHKAPNMPVIVERRELLDMLQRNGCQVYDNGH